MVLASLADTNNGLPADTQGPFSSSGLRFCVLVIPLGPHYGADLRLRVACFLTSGFLLSESCPSWCFILLDCWITRLSSLTKFSVTRLSVLAEFSVPQLSIVAEFFATWLSMLVRFSTIWLKFLDFGLLSRLPWLT
jgi:hypothetical protein